MLIPARLRLVAAITIGAVAFLSPCCSRIACGQDGLSISPKDIPKLIELAKANGIDVDLEQTTTTKKAAGSGAGARSTGGDLKQQVKSDAPEARLGDEASSKGGNNDSKTEAEAAAASIWSSPWFWAGVVCELIAGALVVVPMMWPALLPIGVKIGIKVPMGFALAGGAFLFAAWNPALATVAVLAAVACVAGPKLLTEFERLKQAKAAGQLDQSAAARITTLEIKAAANLSALDEVMEMIANEPTATTALKAHLDKHADDPDKPLILERAIRAGVKFA